MTSAAEVPGPVEPYVLTDQGNHRSEAVWAGEDSKIRYVDHRGFEWDLTNDSVKERVKAAGFDIFSSIRYVRLDHALLTAFIERWRGETNTFHMPVGEMTITLQDVEVLTGLRVDGRALVANMYEDWENLSEYLLGEVPEEIIKGMVPISWLYSTFGVVSEQPKHEDHVARAYILYLIGTRLMPYSSGNLVHLKWLMFVADFESCGEFAWGAALLAHLYHEMRRASGRHCMTTTACYALVQLWIWERFPSFRPDVHDPLDDFDFGDNMSYGSRWGRALTYVNRLRTSNVRVYRKDLDLLDESRVYWTPYKKEILQKLPSRCWRGKKIWRTCAPLLSMHIAEPHCPHRVMRQFGRVQRIPAPVTKYENYSRRGRKLVKWLDVRADLISDWEKRYDCIADDQKLTSALSEQWMTEYQSWYWTITRRYISPIAYQNIGDEYDPRPVLERTLMSLTNHVGRLRRKYETAGNIPQEVFADFEDLWRHYDYVAQTVDIGEEPETTGPAPAPPNASGRCRKRVACGPSYRAYREAVEENDSPD